MTTYMKVLFVILNSVENKAQLFNLIDKYNAYLLPEILHIPLSAFDWNNNCYKMQNVINLIHAKTQAYPIDYVIGVGNLNICDKMEKLLKYDKIIIIEERNLDKIEFNELFLSR